MAHRLRGGDDAPRPQHERRLRAGTAHHRTPRVKPVLSHDARPIEKLAEARTEKEAAKEIRQLLRKAKTTIEGEIGRKASEGLLKHSTLRDAAEQAHQFPESEEAHEAAEQACEKLEKAYGQIRNEVQERRAPDVAALSKDAAEKSAVAKKGCVGK